MGFLVRIGNATVFVLVAAVLLTSTPVAAQVAFDECGIFVSDPAGSCPLFAPYALPGNYLVDLGTLPVPPPGTEARISGTMEDCVATCFPMACIFDATLDPSCGGPPPPPEPPGAPSATGLTGGPVPAPPPPDAQAVVPSVCAVRT